MHTYTKYFKHIHPLNTPPNFPDPPLNPISFADFISSFLYTDHCVQFVLPVSRGLSLGPSTGS